MEPSPGDMKRSRRPSPILRTWCHRLLLAWRTRLESVSDFGSSRGSIPTHMKAGRSTNRIS